MKRNLIIIAASLLLSACKIDMIVEVQYSDLLAGEQKFINSSLIIEIPACTEIESSELESSSLLQIKQKVLYYFDKSNYINCVREDFNSYARFEMPVGLNLNSENHLNLHTAKKTLVALEMPRQFRSNITKIEEEVFTEGDINFHIKLVIDQPIEKTIFGYHLWYGNSIDALEPIAVFISENNAINKSVKESGSVTMFFKSSKVIVDMVRSGQVPPILSMGK